jgi:hypothetical protein
MNNQPEQYKLLLAIYSDKYRQSIELSVKDSDRQQNVVTLTPAYMILNMITFNFVDAMALS